MEGDRGAGEEEGGSGITKVAGSGRKRKKNVATLHNISQSKKWKEMGANKYRAGTGIKGYGKWEV